MTCHRFSLLIRVLVLFAVAVLSRPSLLKADDTLSFAFPLVSPLDTAEYDLGGDFAFSYAGETRRYIAVNRVDADLHALGLRLSDHWSLDLAVNGYRCAFSANDGAHVAGGFLSPRTLKGLSVTAGIGYQLNDKWRLEGAFTEGFVNEQDSFIINQYLVTYHPPEVQSHRQTYSASCSYRANANFYAYAGLAATPVPGGTCYWAPVAGAALSFDEHWGALLGLPRTGLEYRQGSATVFAGFLTTGDLYNVNTQVGTILQKYPSEYRETDLALSLRYKVGHTWRVQLEAGLPLEQRFSYSR